MTAIYGRYALFLSLILAFARKGITHIGQALFKVFKVFKVLVGLIIQSP